MGTASPRLASSLVLLSLMVAASASCDAGDSESDPTLGGNPLLEDGDDPLQDEELGEAGQGIQKGFPGAQNGDADYCNNPDALCVAGEGDCDRHTQCTTGYCGTNNGPKFGMPANYDVCVPATCQDGIQNGNETGLDCGGSCGACVCGGTPGTSSYCTVSCPCDAGGGDCDSNAECTTGYCGTNNGLAFGMPADYDVCVDPSCQDGIQNGDETDLDCGGSCGDCVCGGTPGTTDYCTAGCPCDAGEGDCDSAAECTTGVCGTNNGPQYGLPAGYDVCVPSTCADGVQSGDETGVDCGGSCEPCVCEPGTEAPCYTGPAGTEGVGACTAGTMTCNAEGTGYGECTGEVLPQEEDCTTVEDEDCDGLTPACPPVTGGADACPGEPATPILVGAAPVTFTGNTLAAADDHDTCLNENPAADGGDWVYQITVDAPATLRATLSDGAGLDGNLLFRTTCTTELVCLRHATYGNQKELATHVEAGTYYLLVDSVLDAEGAYQLAVQAMAPACGDGVLNAGEACDVGAGVAGDGCGDPGTPEECQLEAPPPGSDACPGEPVTVPVGATRLAASDGYSTLGYADDYESAVCTQVAGGRDRVFALTPEASGVLTVSIGFTEDGARVCDIDVNDPRCWDQILYASSSCGEVLDEIECEDSDYATETLGFFVTEGVPVYLFVDGYDDGPYSSGPFDLDLELTP